MTPNDGAVGGKLPRMQFALTIRTTCIGDNPPASNPLDEPLRTVIARVLDTGRGPAAVVRWVGRETTHTPPNQDADAVVELADRLKRKLLPSQLEETVAD